MKGVFLYVFLGLALLFAGCSSLPGDAEAVTERFEAATGVYNLGESQFNQGLYEASRLSFESALFQYAVLDEREGVVKSYLAMGKSAAALGNHGEALKSFEEALPLAEDLEDNLLIRDTANHFANCYLAMDDLERAGIWSEYGPVNGDDSREMAEYYRLKGTLAKREGTYEEALTLYDRALKIDKGLKDSLQMGTNYYLKGSAYSLMGQYEMAESALLTALKEDRFYEILPGIAADLTALGLVLEKDGREEEALVYFHRAYLAWKGQGNEEKAAQLELKAAPFRED
ncbi:MAG: tetratricopeptide repeat protein [Spirochaetales bacterium]|nr:tetratricopeptide repeat protein [Spirochaetales bacterium]